MLDQWEIVTLLGLLITGYYLYFFAKFRRCGMPGPIPLPVIGNLYHQLKMGHTKADEVWEKKYGKVFGVYSGHNWNVMVTDRELLKEVLVKQFGIFRNRRTSHLLGNTVNKSLFFLKGNDWRRTRNIITPSFSGGKMKAMMKEINECSKVLANTFASFDEEKPIDVKRVFSTFSCDVIAAVAFGIELDSQRNPDEPFVKNLHRLVGAPSGYFSRLPFVLAAVFPSLGPVLYNLGVSVTDKAALTYFITLCQGLLADKRTYATERVDFLQLLLDAEVTEEDRSEKSSTMQHTKRLSSEEIVSQILLFFIAGYETTSSALRYVSYILSQRPDVDEQLVQEIREHLQEREPTFETVSQLKFLDQVVNETLRMFPPAPRLHRVVEEDFRYKGMVIPAGSAIIVPVYHLHRDPEVYQEPEVFKPERFSVENKTLLTPSTFLPFGLGPRQCIGSRLALLEIKTVLVHVLRQVKFVPCEETPASLEVTQVNMTLQPQTAIKLSVQRR